MIIVTPSFRKAPFSKCFSSARNEKPAFSNSSDLKSVFEKLRFRDGLVWTVGLTVGIKLRFQISLTYCSLYSKCSLHEVSVTCYNLYIN